MCETVANVYPMHVGPTVGTVYIFLRPLITNYFRPVFLRYVPRRELKVFLRSILARKC
jgi:hypothetical protein